MGFSPWLAVSKMGMAWWNAWLRRDAHLIAARKQREEEEARDENTLS